MKIDCGDLNVLCGVMICYESWKPCEKNSAMKYMDYARQKKTERKMVECEYAIESVVKLYYNRRVHIDDIRNRINGELGLGCKAEPRFNRKIGERRRTSSSDDILLFCT